MKLGELIIQYRTSHALSQRQFATLCGLSNGYISMLEKEVNPATQKPVTPTIPQLKKLASGMNMTMMELFEQVDNIPVDISPTESTPSDDQPHTVNTIRIAARNGTFHERQLSDQQLAALLAILDQMPDASDDL